MNATEHISRLKREIASGSEIEAKLRRYVNREHPGTTRNVAHEQLKLVTKRIDIAEKELRCLQELQMNVVARAVNSSVKFYGIEEMAI